MSSFFAVLEKCATLWISRSANPSAQALDQKFRLNPSIVVTGGGSGIGLALAREFSARGDTVVLIGRQEGRLKIVARELTHKYGNRILTLALDVTQKDSVDILKRWLSLEGLYCDILANNAGLGVSGPFVSSEIKDIDEVIETNIKGLTRLTRAFLPDMINRGRGGVMNVGSLGGVIPGPWQAVYYASKAFVLSFTEAIASEISGQGVRVCVVVPGPVNTRFHARMGAEEARYRLFLPSANPDKIARSAVRGYYLGRRVINPGLGMTIANYFLRIIPHHLSIPVTNWLLSAKNRDQ